MNQRAQAHGPRAVGGLARTSEACVEAINNQIGVNLKKNVCDCGRRSAELQVICTEGEKAGGLTGGWRQAGGACTAVHLSVGVFLFV